MGEAGEGRYTTPRTVTDSSPSLGEMAAEGLLNLLSILTSSPPLPQTSANRALKQTCEPTGGLTAISESINKVVSEHDFPSCLSTGREGSDHGDKNPLAWVTAASPTVIGWRSAAPPSQSISLPPAVLRRSSALRRVRRSRPAASGSASRSDGARPRPLGPSDPHTLAGHTPLCKRIRCLLGRGHPRRPRDRAWTSDPGPPPTPAPPRPAASPQGHARPARSPRPDKSGGSGCGEKPGRPAGHTLTSQPASPPPPLPRVHRTRPPGTDGRLGGAEQQRGRRRLAAAGPAPPPDGPAPSRGWGWGLRAHVRLQRPCGQGYVIRRTLGARVRAGLRHQPRVKVCACAEDREGGSASVLGAAGGRSRASPRRSRGRGRGAWSHLGPSRSIARGACSPCATRSSGRCPPLGEGEGVRRRPAPGRSGRPAGVLGLAGGGQSASTCCRTGLAWGGCSAGILPAGSPPGSASAQERRDHTSHLASACGLVSRESAATHVVSAVITELPKDPASLRWKEFMLRL